MKKKTIMILAGTAAALQTVAVILAVLLTVFQDTVKQIYGYRGQIYSMKSVPIGAFAELLLPFLVYVIFLLCIIFIRDKVFARQILAIIFAVLAVLFKIGTALLEAWSNVLQARQGISQYADYVTLNTAVLQVTFLFTVTAFALFCMTAGGCLSGRKATPSQEQGTSSAMPY